IAPSIASTRNRRGSSTPILPLNILRRKLMARTYTMIEAGMRLAVIGHVEHITLGRVTALPRAGDIAHLTDVHVLAGGGGGIAFFQLAKSGAELHLFTALGDDDAA